MTRATGSRPAVVFFCKLPPPFTGETVVSETLREFLQDEFSVTSLNTASGSMRVGRRSGPRVFRMLTMIRQVRSLVRYLKRHDVDVLYSVLSHSPAGHLRDILTARWARPHVRKMIAHSHSGNFHENFHRPWHARLSRGMVRNLDKIIFLSERLEARSEAYVPAEKRIILPNTIDRRLLFSDEELEDKLRDRAQRGSLRVVYLSNMIESKGYRDAALGALAYRESGATLPVELDFVGGWPEETDRREFSDLLKANRLDDMVRVHGAVSDRAWIKQLLRQADVFILPTYYPIEAQPLSVIEAMNAGTPIIATAHASLPDYVFDNDNGYLVDKKSPDQIAVALAKLADFENWRRKSRAARRTYLTKFTDDIVKRQLSSTFWGLVE